MDLAQIENIFLENWMYLLGPTIADRRLLDLFIPGAHDANTHTIPVSDFGSAFARCQSVDIGRQAAMGIRFFDLRYGPGKEEEEVRDKHGPFNGGDFFLNIEKLRAFSDNHPEEFFVLSLQAEAQLSKPQKKSLIRKLTGILNGKLVLKSDLDSWFSLKTSTLADIWKTTRRFFVVAREELWTESGFNADMCARLGLHNRDAFLNNKFHNVDDEQLLFRLNIENLTARKTLKETLFASQFVLTTDLKNPKFVLTRLVTMRMPTIISFVNRLHRCSLLPKFIFQNTTRPFNLFLFDQIEYDLNLQKIIISANGKLELAVHRCFLGDKELTEQELKEFTGARQFYVPSVSAVAAEYKPKFAQFCVIHSFGGGDYRVELSRRDADSFLVYDNPIIVEKIVQPYKCVLVFRSAKKFKIRRLEADPSDHECDIICAKLDVTWMIKISGKTIKHFKYSQTTR